MRAMLNNLLWPLVTLAVLGVAHADEPLYTVKAGDTLAIAVWKEPDLTSNAVLVRPDGTFSFPLVGQVDARGKGVQELQNIVTEAAQKIHRRPGRHGFGAGGQGQQGVRDRAGHEGRGVCRQSKCQCDAGFAARRAAPPLSRR